MYTYKNNATILNVNIRNTYNRLRIANCNPISVNQHARLIQDIVKGNYIAYSVLFS